MENQHGQIKEYKDLSQEEINLMNKTKELAEQVGELCEELARNRYTDKRWVAIAKTDLQKGFMALTRTITQPTTF